MGSRDAYRLHLIVDGYTVVDCTGACFGVPLIDAAKLSTRRWPCS